MRSPPHSPKYRTAPALVSYTVISLLLPVFRTVTKKCCGFGVPWGFSLKEPKIIFMKAELSFGENVCLFEQLLAIKNRQFTYPLCSKSSASVLQRLLPQEQTSAFSVSMAWTWFAFRAGICESHTTATLFSLFKFFPFLLFQVSMSWTWHILTEIKSYSRGGKNSFFPLEWNLSIKVPGKSHERNQWVFHCFAHCGVISAL